MTESSNAANKESELWFIRKETIVMLEGLPNNMEIIEIYIAENKQTNKTEIKYYSQTVRGLVCIYYVVLYNNY